MQGNIVSAAKWFGGALVLSSIILVVGLHWSASVTNQRTIEAQIKALDRIDGLLTRLANKPSVPVNHPITLDTLNPLKFGPLKVELIEKSKP